MYSIHERASVYIAISQFSGMAIFIPILITA
jgi:hypothetical protein